MKYNLLDLFSGAGGAARGGIRTDAPGLGGRPAQAWRRALSGLAGSAGVERKLTGATGVEQMKQSITFRREPYNIQLLSALDEIVHLNGLSEDLDEMSLGAVRGCGSILCELNGSAQYICQESDEVMLKVIVTQLEEFLEKAREVQEQKERDREGEATK